MSPISLAGSHASEEGVPGPIPHCRGPFHAIFDAFIFAAIGWGRKGRCLLRLSVLVGLPGRPLTGVRLALRDARLARIEAGFADAYECDPVKRSVVELFDGYVEPVDLRESDLAVVQRVRNSLALAEQPILIRD